MKNPIKSPIQHDKIDELRKELSNKGKCPYTTFIRSMNQFSDYLSTDKLPPVKKAIQQMIDVLFLKKAPDPSDTTLNTIGNGLSKASTAKLYKHLYDVVYLQEELYPLIHRSLDPSNNNAFQELQKDSMKLNLRDDQTRRMRGLKFAHTFGVETEEVIHDWEREKSSDRQYSHALNFAIRHGHIYAQQLVSFGMSFVAGIADAQKNMRSIIEHIPQLFYKKHHKLPTTEEYREIVQTNIKKILIPLSSINLENLTGLVRPKDTKGFEDDEELMIYDDQIILMQGADAFNAFDINTTNFSLDENNLLEATQLYLTERAERMGHGAIGSEYLFSNHNEYYSSGSNMVTGCPALRARTPDGKRVVEQFCEDVLALLDNIYFPYWDK